EARTTRSKRREWPLDPGAATVPAQAGRRSEHEARQPEWRRVDGREADVVTTCHFLGGGLRGGGRRCRRLNARTHWRQPAQARLNQQHQHKGTRFDPPASWFWERADRLGYSVSGFRRRRLDWRTGLATLRRCAGFASHDAPAASTSQPDQPCSKLLWNQ